jgi:peptidoglycan/LPS O-acetylase OafA/YrhL
VVAEAHGAPAPWVERRFRTDIEGLRALAVASVVVYHAWPARLPGGFVGVDVFFVISGFLITGLLVAERQDTGGIGLASFWGRRVRRLVPAAMVTLVGATVVARWGLPPLRFLHGRADLPWTAAYLGNVRFAARSVDYWHPAEPSFVLHYWSLAVEEQFYVLWPIVLVVATRWRRRGIVVATAVVGIASFATSVALTPSHPGAAFFLLPARAWELAAGATIALAWHPIGRVPAAAREALAVGGLVCTAVAALAFGGTAFPGIAAALPVGGTALVLAAGTATGRRTVVDRLLSLRPAQLVGRWSYAIYLWHWPLLLVANEGRASSWPHPRVLAIGASVTLAAATHAVIERPVRGARSLARRPARSLALGAALPVLALVLIAAVPSPPLSATSAASTPTTPRSTVVPADLHPSLADAWEDFAPPFRDGCFSDAPRGTCVYGDPAAGRTVVLFGDSHAGHWFPAFEPIAERDGWVLRLFARPACPSIPVEVAMEPGAPLTTAQCDRWREDAVAQIRSMKPALVVLSNSDAYIRADSGTDIDEVWGSAQRRLIAELAPSQVVVLGATPRTATVIPDCLAAHVTDVDACEPARADAVRSAHLAVERDATTAPARFVDPTPWLCPGARCPVIRHHVLMWTDGGHLSATYAAELTDQVRASVFAAAP